MAAPGHLEHDWFPRPLPASVLIGRRSWWYSSFACLHTRSTRPVSVRVGNDTGIYHRTFFDLGPNGEVEIGNYCSIVGAIISTNGRVIIRDYALIAHEVVIADSFVAAPWDVWQDSPPGAAGEIVVGQCSWIGARAVLLGGARIGEGAVVGAAAVVDFVVPPYAIVAGNPARVVGWTDARHAPSSADAG